MIGLIVTGHGNFPSVLITAIQWFVGKLKDCAAVDFRTEDAPEILYDHLLATVESMDYCESIIILCDLVGGVPYQLSAQIAYDKKNIEVVGGANVGMLIEVAINRLEPDMTVERIANQAVITGRQQISKFHYKDKENESEDL